MSALNPVHIIEKKRDGGTLTTEEIGLIVERFARGELSRFPEGQLPDYQMAALAMAIVLKGMDDAETAALTDAMLRSGDRLNRAAGRGLPRVDKHSTGGVGDKVSLPLAPMLACCGVVVPMISGRGLGATGGTLDKLDSIPGFRTRIATDEVDRLLDTVGVAMAGQTATLVPADRKLYSLRDVTGTVPSIPLITASIMSKKLAESLDALVLDVKWGTGAFMRSLDDARTLARSMVAVGGRHGLRTVALLTDMNQPLGRMAGHVGEVLETLDILQGKGPADVTELTVALGAELLVAAGVASDVDAATERLLKVVADGSALAKFREMVAAQGGRLDGLPALAPAVDVPAPASGFVAGVEARTLGRTLIALGGGRQQATDGIDFTVGLEMLVRIGDRVEAGRPLMRLFAGTKGMPDAVATAASAVSISPESVPAPTLIVERIRG